jgi:hypothetical protein
MKLQIQQLAEKANIEFTYDPTEKPIRAFVECWEDDLEKFAQLIVQECSRVAKLEVGTNRVCDAIEKHFGVEL